MIIRHRFITSVLAAASAILTACARPAASPGPKQAKTAVASAPDTQPASVDLNQIFLPGPGRELVLSNCTTCHTIVPIVTLQMTREAWERNSRDHRGRVTALSNADFKTLYEYLTANFNPNRPVPKLPKELLDTWTSY